MENSNFNTVVVRDSRIQDVSTKLDYKVYKGAAQNHHQAYPAQTQTSSQLSFQVQVPSENQIMDREPTITATPTILIKIGAGVPNGTSCFQYGESEALCQFPLNALFTTSSATINTANVSVNTQDIMDSVLRTYDEETFRKYNTPHVPDKNFKKYSDCQESESNPLAVFKSAKGRMIPRGSHPINFIIRRYVNAALQNTVTNASATADITTALTSTSNATNTWEIELSYTVTEPILFLAPFLWGDNMNNCAGLYGVNAMSLMFNLDAGASRVLCSASPYPMTTSLLRMENCELNMNYLTCQPSDLLATKNVVPYVQYDRYQYSNGIGVVGAGVDKTVSVQAYNLTQIPNRIFVIARKRLVDQRCKDSHTFLPISRVNITFNNVGGILAGAKQHELYRMSRANGSKQDWYEFAGYASNVRGVKQATAGSVLIINPSRDMNLPDYLSNGSVGSFQFAIDVSFKNTEEVDINPEILIISEQNGVFITQSGQSTFQISLLTKDLVVNSTANQFGESDNYIKSFGNDNALNSIASGLKNIPLLNKKKMSVSEGSGAKSGGSYSAGGW